MTACTFSYWWQNFQTGESRRYICGCPTLPCLKPSRRGPAGLRGLLGLPRADGWPANPRGYAHGVTTDQPICWDCVEPVAYVRLAGPDWDLDQVCADCFAARLAAAEARREAEIRDDIREAVADGHVRDTTARKAWTCELCGEQIPPGSRYRRVTVKTWDDRYYRYPTCNACGAGRDAPTDSNRQTKQGVPP